jgi:O-antigen ligase
MEEFQVVFVDSFHRVLGTTLGGLGTGIDTNGARYAFDRPDQFTAVNGAWYESWYVKAYLELGVAGLVLIVAILGQPVAAGLRRHAALRDPGLRAVSASLLALLIWNLVYGLKGQFVDLDPSNVYFWLFIGVLAKLPQLDQKEHVESGSSSAVGSR